MRGGLDETLARMARRDEALRRRAAEENTVALPGTAVSPFGTVAPAGPGTPTDPGTASGPAEAPGRVDGSRNAGPAWGDARSRDPVEEVAEAVRRVVAEHPGTTVSVRVEHDGQAYPLRISWSGTIVTVSAEAATVPPPVWPLSVKTVPAWMPPDGLSPDPASRLAEMIRRDPSLLTDDQPR